jgi:hypothetical protein
MLRPDLLSRVEEWHELAIDQGRQIWAFVKIAPMARLRAFSHKNMRSSDQVFQITHHWEKQLCTSATTGSFGL